MIKNVLKNIRHNNLNRDYKKPENKKLVNIKPAVPEIKKVIKEEVLPVEDIINVKEEKEQVEEIELTNVEEIEEPVIKNKRRKKTENDD